MFMANRQESTPEGSSQHSQKASPSAPPFRAIVAAPFIKTCSSIGAFNTSTASIAGDAIGLSDNKAYGIFGGSSGVADTINVSGNVTAIAQLSNSVLASTVAGNADSTGDSSAIGLSNYDVTIIRNGIIIASAINISKNNASSVSGNANA